MTATLPPRATSSPSADDRPPLPRRGSARATALFTVLSVALVLLTGLGLSAVFWFNVLAYAATKGAELLG